MIPVWDLRIRLFHWSLVGIVAFNQFGNAGGDAIHENLGYAACVLIAWRIYWGIRAGKSSPSLQRTFAALLIMGLMLFCVLLLGLTGWMLSWDRFFGEEWLELTHEYLGDALIVFAAIHVSGVLRDSFRRRENLILSMIHGKKRAE